VERRGWRLLDTPRPCLPRVRSRHQRGRQLRQGLGPHCRNLFRWITHQRA
jgi:hypothetical protein